MKDNCTPNCPMCGNARHVRPNGDRLFYCTACGGLYDDSGDDGTIGYGDPARIAEKREQREIREKRQASEARRRLLKGGLGR